MDPEIFRYVQLGWVILHLILLVPLYLARSRITDKRLVLKVAGYIIALGLIGFIVLQFHESLRSTEIGIILGFPAFGLLVYIVPPLLRTLQDIHIQQLTMHEGATSSVIEDSLSAFSRTVETLGPLEFRTSIKPNRWYEYNFHVQTNGGNRNQLRRELTPTGATFTNFRLLMLLAYYALISPITTNTFALPIPFLNFAIDAELTFFGVILLSLFYLNYLRAIQTQFQDEFTEIQNAAKVNLVKKLAKKRIPTGDDDDSDDSGKSTLDIAKEKAASIKDLRLKEEIKRKQEELTSQINSILGKEELENKYMDNELYQKQKLIKSVQKILNSTPVGKEILIQAIMDKVESEDEELVESIVIGLISNNKVKGRYDIWEKRFLVGDASSRFIEQTLETLSISPSAFEYVKITKSGDVEISFNSNGKKLTNQDMIEEVEKN
ncbi:MAG: hypothetical protein ACXAE3_03750 [Candidatus Kariarchaeaceae archaeon]|jgi:hypothetical protein